jgi:hypothetical protein
MRAYAAGTMTLIAQHAGVVPMIVLWEADFDSTTLRLAQHRANVTIGGNTYLGARGLGKMDTVTDGPGDRQVYRFELSGAIPDNVSLAVAEPVQGRPFRIYAALFDPTTYALVEKAQRVTGTLNAFTVAKEKGKAVISATAQGNDVDLYRASGSMWSNAEQQRLFPGDLGWQFCAAQVEQQIVFPAASYFRK